MLSLIGTSNSITRIECFIYTINNFAQSLAPPITITSDGSMAERAVTFLKRLKYSPGLGPRLSW